MQMSDVKIYHKISNNFYVGGKEGTQMVSQQKERKKKESNNDIFKHESHIVDCQNDLTAFAGIKMATVQSHN